MKKIIAFLVLLALGGGALRLWSSGYFALGAEPAEYKTEKIKRGDVLARISATGTIEPEEVVDVGAQVAGQVIAFGKDSDGKPINYGSRVEQDTVLAKIDDALFVARLQQAQASLKRAEADLQFSQARLKQAERDWRRAGDLQNTPGTISPQEYDAYVSSFETAKANVAVNRAAIAVAKANLKEAETNVQYVTIRSPVRGVILDRRVNIGQTVVASLNTPSLFLIAKDLKHMEIWASVNEADVGGIHVGQKVSFKVAAFPGQTFPGQVSQVRLNATMNSSVVLYTVVVGFDNSGGKLLPYLTANLQFEVSEKKNVLKVPNALLRWRPRRDTVHPESLTKFDEFVNQRGTDVETNSRALLWRQDGRLLRHVEVGVGLTDGSETEILTNELHEGDDVVSGVNRQSNNSDTSRSLVPQVKKRKMY
jgi:HlyD family secretion protein